MCFRQPRQPVLSQYRRGSHRYRRFYLWLLLGFEDMANAMELEAVERVKSDLVFGGDHHELHS